MSGHLNQLLENLVAAPESRLSQLDILTAAERRQIVSEWNETATEYESDKCVHQLFEEQVERTPDRIALIFKDQQVTYAELNARANQLAHHLKTLGVGTENRVAIFVERSIEMVVGFLGVLKAGAAYVPLDPIHPKERLEFLLEDVEPTVIITQRSLVQHLSKHGAKVVCLDSDWDAIAAYGTGNVSSESSVRHLAYIIYTSGSTGRPKGVMVEHRGLCNAVNWVIETLELTPDDRCMFKTPFTFDAAGRETFATLLSGGCFVVAVPDGHRDSRYLAETIRDQRLTVFHGVPSMLRLLVEEPAFDDSVALRAVMCGGEALPPEVVARFRARSRAKLYNVYGPTETIIDSTYWLCDEGEHVSIPIGRPIPNARVYILDKFLRPVPVGVVGGLYIGGIGVARGYLNRPDLTTERFIADPFSSEVGARLYKTGDLGRYLVDRNIEYCGRDDFQVKIRGFRIELGEIESVLEQHPAVRAAVVIAREEQSGDKQLVAHLAVRAGQAPKVGELRGYLKDKLPQYMTPAAFVLMAEMPLTPNGKVDRAKLPAPDVIAATGHRGFVAPRDDIERGLQSIWEEVLNVQPIGIRHDFFELGGHSLLAIKVLARTQRKFNYRIPLAAMFPTSTIEQLAARIRGDSDGSALLALDLIQPQGSLPPLFVVGNSPVFRLLARDLGADQPMIALLIPDELRMRLPYNLEEIAARQAESVMRFTASNTCCVAGFSAEGVLAFEVACQLRARGRDVALLVLIDTVCPSQPHEPSIVQVARKAGVHLRAIRAQGLEGARITLGGIFRRALLRLKSAGSRLGTRLGILHRRPAPIRPEDLVTAMALATRRYAPPPYDAPVLLFKRTTSLVGRFRLRDYGWGGVVRNGPEVFEIPGDHFALLAEPGVGMVAGKLVLAMKSACDSAAEFKSAATG